jgi:Zn-finger nucleic acid-binding protein
MNIKCPRCNVELKEISYESVVVDRCPSCEGEWLDKSEISTITEARTVIFTSDEVNKVKGVREPVVVQITQPPKSVLCPRCNVQMKQINYSYSTGIIVDRCPRCEGIWLNKDELEHIQIVMEDLARKMPELRSKFTPVLNEIRLKHQQAGDKIVDSTMAQGIWGKSPIVASLVRFIVRHF